MGLKLIIGDITQASSDAIVNAANPTLLGGGGVDGAIHRAAGPELLKACQALDKKNGMRCPPGEARITESGNLGCRYVIHTVGPVYHSDPTPSATLTNAYQNSCKLAISHDCKKIAFPAISCGVYGYPHDEAAKIALTSCLPFANEMQISFYLFSQDLHECFARQWQKLENLQQQ